VTERSSKWGLRLLALVAAMVIWWMASVEKRERVSEKVVDASVTYNSPAGLILLDPIQTVKVRLRGPDRRIRAIAPFQLDVVVDVTGHQPGTIQVQLTQDDVITPDEVSVVSIEPNVLQIQVDRESTVSLPVHVPLIGEPAGGAVPEEPHPIPDHVRVRGPESLVSGLAAVSTSPISLDGHALSFVQKVSVVPTDPLVHVVEPPFVTVQVPMRNPDIPTTPAPAAPGSSKKPPRQ